MSAIPSCEPLCSDSSHWNPVTSIPLESIRPTHRFQKLWSVLSESNSLVAPPRLVSLLLSLWDWVQICHLPGYSSFTASVSSSHSSWVRSIFYITLLAALYWAFASAKYFLVHRWSVRGKLVEGTKSGSWFFLLSLSTVLSFFPLLFRYLYQQSSVSEL